MDNKSELERVNELLRNAERRVVVAERICAQQELEVVRLSGYEVAYNELKAAKEPRIVRRHYYNRVKSVL